MMREEILIRIDFMGESNIYMEKGWFEVLKDEFTKPYMQQLQEFLKSEVKSGNIIYPPHELIFNALCQTPYSEVKVVIIGQDPYHGAGQAHGLCFSVPEGVPPPPSLNNIFKEQFSDVGITPPTSGCLLSWAKQGVLLLNATLTVRANTPLSHHGRGWEEFTDAVMEKLIKREDPIVFMMWGKLAQEKCLNVVKKYENNPHLILTAAHPSPLSATGFFGCRHFSKANNFLVKVGKEKIDWQIK